MEWPDDRLTEEQALFAKQSAIRTDGKKVYDALWQQIRAFVDDIASKSPQKGLTLNGAAYDRVIRRGSNVRAWDQRPSNKMTELHVRMNQVDMIEATGPDVNLRFMLDVREDIVCLTTLEGKIVSYPEAAIRILDPFVFPGLPTRSE